MTAQDLKMLGQELRRMERYQELNRMEPEKRDTNPWAMDVHNSSSSSTSDNNISRRHATELARPLEAPSCPPPTYTPPLTAQARARTRLGYSGAKSALPNTLSPWGDGTAGTDIDRPAPAIVPGVDRPPPYIFHARDRFLETGLAAAFDRNSRYPPPPTYGMVRTIALLGGTTTSGNRSTGTAPCPPSPVHSVAPTIALHGVTTTAPTTPTPTTFRSFWSRGRRSSRSFDTVDIMLDLERGTPRHKETDFKKFAAALFLLVIVVVIFSVVSLTSRG